ncbi:MAG: GNAT family N-acetyltransferase [Erysipelotrichaceae bacterium]|nr:GNAT family N-acetyltransferase [Erysipelotrichaceae bacterium]
MININNYVKKFGNESFKKRPFNDVDGLVFAEISMINFDLLLQDRDSLALKDIVIYDYKKTIYGSPDAKANGLMLRRMMESKRYKDVKVCFVQREFKEDVANQFYAVTFILPDGTMYLSFRGTDITIVGWKEDLYMTFQERILAQEQALRYTEYVVNKLPGNFILGGHSKGGNLAVYVGLNIDKKYNDRLLSIYSYDGPGFLNGVTRFPNYLANKDKVHKLLTDRSLVGTLFNDVKETKIVYSTGMLLGGHDPFAWKVDNNTGEFITRNKRSKNSRVYSTAINMWLNQLSKEDKLLGIAAVAAIIGKAQNIYDLLKYLGANIAKYNSVIKKFPLEDRKKLKSIVSLLFESIKIVKKSSSLQKSRVVLVTERLILREMRNSDFDALEKIISDPETMKYYPAPYDEEGVYRWIIWCIGSYRKDGFGLWAVTLKKNGEMIGDCGVSMQPIDGKWRPEIGYHINKKYQRQGYGKEMTKAVKDFFFQKFNYDEVYSYMRIDNIPSIKIAEANKMKRMGTFISKDGQECCFYRITRSEWEEDMLQ